MVAASTIGMIGDAAEDSWPVCWGCYDESLPVLLGTAAVHYYLLRFLLPVDIAFAYSTGIAGESSTKEKSCCWFEDFAQAHTRLHSVSTPFSYWASYQCFETPRAGTVVELRRRYCYLV